MAENSAYMEATAAAEVHRPGGIGPIGNCVREVVETYLHNLNGHEGDALYKLVLEQVEQPLLEVVMRHCGGNQTRAAELLGINRGTLRKKLQQYQFDH